MTLRVIHDPEAACLCCRRPRPEVSGMFGSGDLILCAECITFSPTRLQESGTGTGTGAGAAATAGADLGQTLPDPVSPPPLVPRSPAEYKRLLDEHVIGQDYAKEKLAIALYEHALRILHPERPLPKSNILLMGQTGTGKTLLAQTMARILQLPFAIGDATSFTPTGFRGEDIESLLSHLYTDARENLEWASRGVVYIDEFDKLARLATTADGRNFGVAVQQHLLKLIEGTTAEFPVTGPPPYHKEFRARMDTRSILFIMGGAFSGLEQIIDRRLRRRGRVGFQDEDSGASGPAVRKGSKNRTAARTSDRNATPVADIFAEVIPADLEEFGLISELVGRLPVTASLAPLTEQDLLRILTEPANNLIERYRNYFDMSNHRIVFTGDALREVARQATGLGCGARGLVTIMEDVLHPLKFHAPGRTSETYAVTSNVVRRLLDRGRQSASRKVMEPGVAPGSEGA